MRRNVLLRSVARLLPDATVHDAVFMWRRAPWMIGAVVVTVAVALAGLTLVGYGSASTRFVLALAVGLVAGVVGTDQRVLADTDAGVVMMQGGKVRQVATEVIRPLGVDDRIEMVSSNLVLTDWMVAGERFTVPKRSQQAMTAIADAR